MVPNMHNLILLSENHKEHRNNIRYVLNIHLSSNNFSCSLNSLLSRPVQFYPNILRIVTMHLQSTTSEVENYSREESSSSSIFWISTKRVNERIKWFNWTQPQDNAQISFNSSISVAIFPITFFHNKSKKNFANWISRACSYSYKRVHPATYPMIFLILSSNS